MWPVVNAVTGAWIEIEVEVEIGVCLLNDTVFFGNLM